jgi:hypothetical protein
MKINKKTNIKLPFGDTETYGNCENKKSSNESEDDAKVKCR